MKNFKFLFAATLFCFQFHIYSQAPSGFYIINGEEIEIDVAPWQVSLEIDGTHQCGGAILNQYWILTAAHCINDQISLCTNNVIVHAGATDQTNDFDGQRIPASRIIPLILGNGVFSTYNEDIALIQLSSPLSFNSDVQPIPFAQPGTVLFGTGLLTGWGETGSGISDVLMKTEIPLITHLEFLDIIDQYPGCDSNRDYISNNMIVFTSTQSSIGGGDSEGPAVLNLNGDNILVGVCSWGINCAEHKFSVYTKIQNYDDFIVSHIDEESTNSCPIKQSLPFAISRNYNVWCPMSVTHDVTVKTGATLTITDEVYFGADVTLTVESGATLIIDGGILTSCDPQNPWKGIK